MAFAFLPCLLKIIVLVLVVVLVVVLYYTSSYYSIQYNRQGEVLVAAFAFASSAFLRDDKVPTHSTISHFTISIIIIIRYITIPIIIIHICEREPKLLI